MKQAKSKGRIAMDAYNAARPVYARPDARMNEIHPDHRCDSCGCKAQSHAQGGHCPRTVSWGSPAPFPSMDLDDASFRAATDVYWLVAGTTFKAK